ncbi:hypothetical protein GCM10009802_33470 [Streptomyces synnematoformans]|uniref:Uncharacterized protein n=1 Tax=Streptomyces synnematoformans TaxID=415721 RepID=A0ABP5KA02_9ACTN
MTAPARRTYLSPPVDLPIRDGKEAQPSPGCETCSQLDRNAGPHATAATTRRPPTASSSSADTPSAPLNPRS